MAVLTYYYTTHREAGRELLVALCPGAHLQVDCGVCPVALNRVQSQVTVEVLRIES